MKHYGGEQFLEDEAYHCKACEEKITEDLRRFAREQQAKWYPMSKDRVV
jgi:hypothetical protein